MTEHLDMPHKRLSAATNVDYLSHLWQQRYELDKKEELLRKQQADGSYFTQRSRRQANFINLTTPVNQRPTTVLPRRPTTVLPRDLLWSSKNVIRLRPAIANSPQEHILLEKEKLAQSELRHKFKTPAQLMPIEIKPLCSSKLRQKHTKGETTDAKRMTKSLPAKLDIPPRRTSVRLGGSISDCTSLGLLKDHKDISDMSAADVWHITDMTFLPNSRSKEQLDSLFAGKNECTQSKPPFPMTNVARSVPHNRKPYRNQGNYKLKSPKSNINLILEATKCSEWTVNDVLDTVAHAQNGTWNDSRTGFSPDNVSADEQSENHASQRFPFLATRKPGLVVHIPDVSCVPATPEEKTESTRPYERVTSTLGKVLKQKELRARELCNLFLDIHELNEQNSQLVIP